MTGDIAIHIFFVPELELPWVVKVAFVFEVDMDANIAVFVPQVPFFQAVGDLPVVESLHDLGNFLRA